MKQKGFSLIELLVVVALIGILAVVGVVVYNGFIDKAEEATCKKQHNDIKEIIQLKFVEARMKSGPGIQYSGDICVQYFYPCCSGQTYDFASSGYYCEWDPGGQLYSQHIQGMGIRNCSSYHNSSNPHPHYVGCIGKECPALSVEGGSLPDEWTFADHPVGGTVMSCGSHAGLSDERKCYFGTRVSKDKIIEEFITK